MKKNNRGGARSNSGRKPVADKKESITVYIEGSKVAMMGGKEILRKKILAFIEKELYLH